MKKISLLSCLCLMAAGLFSCSNNNAPSPDPQPEPEPESIFGNYQGTFTTRATLFIYENGDTTIQNSSNTKPGTIRFRAGASESVVMDYKSGLYFNDSFAYNRSNSYHLPHRAAIGLRTLVFSLPEKSVKLVDSSYERLFAGSPENPQYNYDKITITEFTGNR